MKPNEKQPLYVYDVKDGKKKFLDIEIQTKDSQYRNIYPLNLNEAGSSLFIFLNQEQNIMIVRIEIIIQEDYVVVNFLDRTGFKDILIQNQSHYKALVY